MEDDNNKPTYVIKYFSTYHDKDELKKLSKFIEENELETSANKIIEDSMGDLNGHTLTQWIDAYIASKLEFEFYVVMICTKNEVVAIGMIKIENNEEIIDTIKSQNKIIGWKLVNVAVSKSQINSGIGTALINAMEYIIDHIMKSTHDDLKKLGDNTKYDIYIWGNGGKNIIWQNFDFLSVDQYITSLRKFYEKLNFITEKTENTPFLFYKFRSYNPPIQHGGWKDAYLNNKTNYLGIE